MEIEKDDALRMVKALTLLLLDSMDRGTLPPELYADLLMLLLTLEEKLGV